MHILSSVGPSVADSGLALFPSPDYYIQGEGSIILYSCRVCCAVVQACGHYGWVVDVLNKHEKVRCITCSQPAIVVV